ncbi:WD40/YVTN/BNR-like repeat-containing protein [Anaerosporobacter sp.]|uniref:WD40/YVTN/BNR-like repeat-containing protein n=1 Tax=Anaerosporobacter sp. TaxID=1872529 RepID=UPI00286ED0AE|nr:hypothetical protein [Anaerosporobacter sp.]
MHTSRKRKLFRLGVIMFVIFIWCCPEDTMFREDSLAKNDETANNNSSFESNNVETEKEWKPNHGTIDIEYKDTGHYDDVEEYVFINSEEGWKGYIAPAGAGSDSLELYKTTDGGINWISVSTLESGGDFVFLNNNIGWIVHNAPINGALQMQKTCNGGKTWVEEVIQAPTEYKDVQFSASLPVFFSQQDGIMIALCQDTNNNYEYIEPVAFITHDGGETWNLSKEGSKDSCFRWDINEEEEYREIRYNDRVWKSMDNIEWCQFE